MISGWPGIHPLFQIEIRSLISSPQKKGDGEVRYWKANSSLFYFSQTLSPFDSTLGTGGPREPF